MKTLFGALIITLFLSISVFAGEIPSDGFGGSPPGNSQINSGNVSLSASSARVSENPIGLKVAIIEIVSDLLAGARV